MKLETPHHIITSCRKEKPNRACTGLCLRVWWNDDISINVLEKDIHCPGCDGKTVEAVEGKHYTVLEHISLHQGNELKMLYSSFVKPEYADLAKSTWSKK